MKTWIHGKSSMAPVLLLAVAVLLCGCTGITKPATHYLLRALPAADDETTAPADRDSLSLLVGPITLPAYLDRTQIVSMTGNQAVTLDKFNRWAEPLQDNFYRVLVENLSLLLQTPTVYAYNRRGSTQAEFQIVIDVTRFDSDAQGDAYLVAFWSVASSDGKSRPMSRKSVIRKSAESPGVTGAVDAQNRALIEFTREIAGAVQSLQR